MPASTSSATESLPTLLAVDLGLRSGLALYRRDGRLLWYRSTNFGSPRRLRQALYGFFSPLKTLQLVVLEGGGQLEKLWRHECQRRAYACQTIAAETWRRPLLIPRRQQGAQRAKQSADELARVVIDRLALKRPTSLRHDASEAILIGLFALIQLGWHDPALLQPISSQFPPGLLEKKQSD